MFFKISKVIDETFPNNIIWGDQIISYDNGWTLIDNVLYKGFSTNGLLDIKSIDEVKQYENAPGTFCILINENNEIRICAGEKQKFPLFCHDDYITNLVPSHTPLYVTNHSKTFVNLPLSDDEILDKIDSLLEQTVVNFKTDKPFKLYLTGGVDTLILASYILKNNIPYELVREEHVEMDHFLCCNRTKLKEFWAYKDLQHWRQPTILISGMHGDENLLRNPMSAHVLMKEHGDDLIDICNQNRNLYHSKYFLKEKNIRAIRLVDDEVIDDAKQWILDRNAYDYQHWHLGNTILFTPFDNLELTNLMLNLSYETLKTQMTDAAVSKELIRRNYPRLLRFLSPSKNYNNFSNLVNVYEGIEKLEG